MLFNQDFIPTGGNGRNYDDGGSGGGNGCCGGGNGNCAGDKGRNACGGVVNGDVSGGNYSCGIGGASDSNGEKLCCKMNTEDESECHISNKSDSEATNGENEDKCECDIQNNSVSKSPISESDSEIVNEDESDNVIPEHTQGSTSITFVGRRVTIPDSVVFTDYRCVYVGPTGPSLTSLLVRFPQSIFYQVCVFKLFVCPQVFYLVLNS